MKYYSVLRPVSLGTFPKPADNKVVTIENFDDRTYVESIGREAWGYVEYEHKLDDALAKGYELVGEGEWK